MRWREQTGPSRRQHRLLRPRAARGRHSGRAGLGARCARRRCDAAGVGTRDDFYWTLHAVFVKRHEHSLLFDQAFRIFFRQRGYARQADGDDAAAGAAARRTRRRKPGAAARAGGAVRRARTRRAQKPQEIEIDARLTVSDREVLQKKDFAQMTAAEIAAAKDAISGWCCRSTRSRRGGSRRTGTAIVIDLRRTLRASMKAGGALIDLKYLGPRRPSRRRSWRCSISPAR